MISSIPVVTLVFEKYILLRFESEDERGDSPEFCEPTVSVVPLIVIVSDATDTEALPPSMVSKVR